MRTQVYSLLVENISGVLARISGLFSRRGYNIDSITVGTTADPRYSRMTIVSTGDEPILDQIEKQLMKQEDVVDVKVLKEGASVVRELILVKVKASKEDRRDIIDLANVFRANVVDLQKGSMILELTGGRHKTDAFIQSMKQYEILELARTGVTGLSRGEADVKML